TSHWSTAARHVTPAFPDVWTQAPSTHVSTVQALSSSHSPSAVHGRHWGMFLSGCVQIPVARLHVPAVSHGSAAARATGLAPTKAPSMHVSVRIHQLPTSLGAPSAFLGAVPVPVAGSHAPSPLPWSTPGHTTGSAPTQAPA